MSRASSSVAPVLLIAEGRRVRHLLPPNRLLLPPVALAALTLLLLTGCCCRGTWSACLTPLPAPAGAAVVQTRPAGRIEGPRFPRPADGHYLEP